MTKVIRISEETYNKLKAHGSYGDSMDNIVSKLIKSYENITKIARKPIAKLRKKK